MPIAAHQYGAEARIIGQSNPVDYRNQVLSQSPLVKRVIGELPRGGGLVEYMQFGNVPMQDWDFPDAIHHDNSVTIRHLGDALDSMAERVSDNPNERWKMYLTPGGVRAWNLTDQISPTQNETAIRYANSMQSDPLYARFSREKDVWSSRISAKNRPDDFIAYPIAHVGTGLPNPQNVDLVNRYHDNPIIENRYISNVSGGGLPRSGLELLERQIQTVPRKTKPYFENLLNKIAKISRH